MIKIKNTYFFIYLAIAIVIIESCNPENKHPILQFEEEVYDFGTIKDDSNLVVNFEFKNIGVSNLEIKKANADCGCTTVKFEKKEVKPGESGIIEIVYSPISNNDSGSISKNIALISNEQTPIRIIKIKGNVTKQKVN